MAGAGLIKIKRRIKSVTSTQKITKAMGLVATSKLRKLKLILSANDKYYDSFKEIVSDAARSIEEYNIYTHGNKSKKKLFIVLTSDSGLCGGFNANVVNQAAAKISEDLENSMLITVGQKGRMYFRRKKIEAESEFVDISDVPTFKEAETIAYKALQMFETSQVGEVYVVYTKFVSSISQNVSIEKVLPLGFNKNTSNDHFILFEPSIENLINSFAVMEIKQQLLNFLINAKASEEGSRMAAMDGATKNADEILDNLKLKYNRIRQGVITQEISEIVGGAEAQK
jgi:F-type H+-transporting ATPase subunit gamma